MLVGLDSTDCISVPEYIVLLENGNRVPQLNIPHSQDTILVSCHKKIGRGKIVKAGHL